MSDTTAWTERFEDERRLSVARALRAADGLEVALNVTKGLWTVEEADALNKRLLAITDEVGEILRKAVGTCG